MTNVLTVTKLNVGYQNRIVLHEVSLQVPAGGCVGLVGESGSGKSTLARTIMGLQSAHSGTVQLCGSSAKTSVQMVFQDPISSLNPYRSVLDIVAEPLTIKHIGTRTQRREKAAELLHRVGLAPQRFGDIRPTTLSGGEAQRVAIARALAAKPDLLICDEPVSSLDVSVQARVLNLLADLREQEGLSILFITHDLAVVRMISDSVAVLYQGRIVEKADVETLIRCPQHAYTRELLAAAPRLPIPAM